MPHSRSVQVVVFFRGTLRAGQFAGAFPFGPRSTDCERSVFITVCGGRFGRMARHQSATPAPRLLAWHFIPFPAFKSRNDESRNDESRKQKVEIGLPARSGIQPGGKVES